MGNQQENMQPESPTVTPPKKYRPQTRHLIHAKGHGRPKGAKNKISGDVKQLVLQALADRGGAEFFRKLKAPEFARIVARLVPNAMQAELSGSLGVTVQIVKFSEVNPNETKPV